MLNLVLQFPVIDLLETLDICEKSLKLSLRKSSRQSVHIDKGHHGEMQKPQECVLEYEKGMNLGGNNISVEGLKDIRDGIQLSGKVITLDLCTSLYYPLDENNIKGEDRPITSEAMEGSEIKVVGDLVMETSLTCLNLGEFTADLLGQNLLFASGGEAIFRELGENRTLTTLILGMFMSEALEKCAIGDEGLKDITAHLGKNTTLTTLNLGKHTVHP